MKKHFVYLVLFLCLQQVNASDDLLKFKLLESTLQRFHIEPATMDQHFFEKVVQAFMDETDPYQCYYQKNFYQKILQQTPSNPQEWLNVYDLLFAHYQKNYLLLNDSNNLKSYQFNYTQEEFFTLSKAGEFNFLNDFVTQQKRHQNYLQFKSLNILSDLNYESYYHNKSDSLTLLYQEIKTALLEQQISDFKEAVNYPEDFRESLLHQFLNCIAKRYDPHSNYFSYSHKKDFDKHLSKNYPIFGFVLQKNQNNEVEVFKIQPGGAAWVSNQVHKGDVVKAIQIEGGKIYQSANTSFDKMMELIGNVEDQTVEFTFLKLNGSIQKVQLQKQEMEMQDNIVKSYVLEGEEKLGYIALPGFYMDYDEGSNLGCANDVAKELFKLKREAVNGIVLDLRNNGGGSLKEAIELAGIFIDAGPILIDQKIRSKAQTLKDFNRGAAYDGPLMVMVNNNSASASEVVASALQDYNRALIVGQSTHGKATEQMVLPIDTTVYTGKAKYGEHLGYAKITVGTLYRITGASNQKTGMDPDVFLPGLPAAFLHKEADYDNAIANNSIDKKTYYKAFIAKDLSSIKEASKQNIQKDPKYSKFVQKIKAFEKLWEKYRYQKQLNLNAYLKYNLEITKLSNEISDLLQSPSKNYKVDNVAFDKMIINANEENIQNNENAIKNIQNDIELNEAYSIFKSYIQLK